MANRFGAITVDEQSIMSLDAPPASGLGTVAEIGDLAIVDGQPGLYQKFGAGATQWLQFAQSSQNIYYPASASGLTSTSSLTDVLISGMTLTPPAGTYLVFFQGSATSNAGSVVTFFSVYGGGVKVTNSEITLRQNSGSVKLPVYLVAIPVTVNGAQAVEIRWRVSNGTANLLANGRYLTLLQMS